MKQAVHIWCHRRRFGVRNRSENKTDKTDNTQKADALKGAPHRHHASARCTSAPAPCISTMHQCTSGVRNRSENKTDKTDNTQKADALKGAPHRHHASARCTSAPAPCISTMHQCTSTMHQHDAPARCTIICAGTMHRPGTMINAPSHAPAPCTITFLREGCAQQPRSAHSRQTDPH